MLLDSSSAALNWTRAALYSRRRRSHPPYSSRVRAWSYVHKEASGRASAAS
ncbi:hypothetical protein ABT052_19605 [Streptomyces sp. NPDC002766]|uniref:hypothetical protein n=1 Tax=unclassified Streptomyces TaxID=2593676 RepID=UPI00332CE23A